MNERIENMKRIVKEEISQRVSEYAEKRKTLKEGMSRVPNEIVIDDEKTLKLVRESKDKDDAEDIITEYLDRNYRNEYDEPEIIGFKNYKTKDDKIVVEGVAWTEDKENESLNEHDVSFVMSLFDDDFKNTHKIEVKNEFYPGQAWHSGYNIEIDEIPFIVDSYYSQAYIGFDHRDDEIATVSIKNKNGDGLYKKVRESDKITEKDIVPYMTNEQKLESIKKENIMKESKAYYEYPENSGCHVRETANAFVAIDKNGNTIGQSKTKAGVEALIDEKCSKKQMKEDISSSEFKKEVEKAIKQFREIFPPAFHVALMLVETTDEQHPSEELVDELEEYVSSLDYNVIDESVLREARDIVWKHEDKKESLKEDKADADNLESKFEGATATFTHLDDYEDAEGLEERENEKCTITALNVFVDDNFENCYWSIKFDDGEEFDNVPGIALKLDEKSLKEESLKKGKEDKKELIFFGKKVKKDELEEASKKIPYGLKAFQLNEIISHMNNENAYYGSGWLYVWPDGTETVKEAQEYFGEKEEYEELEELFKKIYKRYHRDGLYKVDDKTLAAARKWDKKLGLSEIVDVGRKDSKLAKLDDDYEKKIGEVLAKNGIEEEDFKIQEESDSYDTEHPYKVLYFFENDVAKKAFDALKGSGEFKTVGKYVEQWPDEGYSPIEVLVSEHEYASADKEQ